MQATELGLKATILAVREEIVSYFKGHCVERFAYGPVELRSTAEQARYNYERRAIDITQPVKLLVSGVRIFNLSKEPNTIIFNLNALERSPQLREVRKAIEEVVDNYLMGVTKEYTGAKPKKQRDDSVLVKDGQLRTKEMDEGPRLIFHGGYEQLSTATSRSAWETFQAFTEGEFPF